jgi:uncharacterized membrane protein
MKTKPSKQQLDPMVKNPSNWKWIFYVNSNDPRIFVPKMNPKFGWTLNLGNKNSYLCFVAIVLIVVAIDLLL